MSSKTGLPTVIADRRTRVLISSISAYEKCRLRGKADRRIDNGIKLTLKSGCEVFMDFAVTTLRDEAIEWLDDQFEVSPLEVRPCGFCKNNVNKVVCEWCDAHDGYNKFENAEVV